MKYFLKPDLSRFCVCFCIEESAPLFSLLGTPRQEPPLLLWCHSSVASRWPQLRFSNVVLTHNSTYVNIVDVALVYLLLTFCL